MKAYEFSLKLNEQGLVELPTHIKAALESGGDAKLIVLLEEAEDEEQDWQRLAIESFFADDDPADNIYYQHYLETLNPIRGAFA
ncbi:MAG: hypothetical protein ACRCYY_20190 [Trueperaceae bacterium]